MRVGNRSTNRLRLQNASFYLLFAAFIALAAFLTQRHTIEFDWTAGKRNTLSPTSEKLLASLDKPLYFAVYATEDNNIREPIISVIKRYQRVYQNTHVQFINPELEPALARELGITADGEVMIHYDERSEKLKQHNEQAYSNAILRLARSETRWLVFLSGHGERNPLGKANHDLGEWGKQLQTRGIKVQPLNLTEQPTIPDNTAALVIASPQVNLLGGEVEIIHRYIEQGKNLLWMLEPGSLHGLQTLAAQLNLEFKSGTIVDATTKLFGVKDPRIAIVSQYPQHPISQGFEVLTLFPQSTALFTKESSDQQIPWQSNPFLLTLERSWLESGPLTGEINYDKAHDLKGPLVIGLSLTREIQDSQIHSGTTKTASGANTKTQRIVVIGDGDFLSNTYIGNGGNMDLGLRIANWLSHDDKLLNIPRKSAADINLQLSSTMQWVIAIGFLFIIPLTLAAGGFLIWWRRRQR